MFLLHHISFSYVCAELIFLSPALRTPSWFVTIIPHLHLAIVWNTGPHPTPATLQTIFHEVASWSFKNKIILILCYHLLRTSHWIPIALKLESRLLPCQVHTRYLLSISHSSNQCGFLDVTPCIPASPAFFLFLEPSMFPTPRVLVPRMVFLQILHDGFSSSFSSSLNVSSSEKPS